MAPKQMDLMSMFAGSAAKKRKADADAAKASAATSQPAIDVNARDDGTVAVPCPPAPAPAEPAAAHPETETSASETAKRRRAPDREASRAAFRARLAEVPVEELPAFLAVADVAEADLPTALAHSKMVKAAAETPMEATWRDGEDVPYFFLCDALAEVSALSGRLEVSAVMAKCFAALIEAAPGTLQSAVYLSLNKLAPAVEGIELGIGDAFLVKCIAGGGGLSEKQIREKYKKTGDLAEVAQYTKSNQTMLIQPKRLTVMGVYASLKQVALASGKEVQKRRSDWISAMMRAAKPIEANFMTRSLQGKMRIGLAEQTVLSALAHAFVLVEYDVCGMPDAALQWLMNSAADRLKRAFNEMPSFDALLPALLRGGLRSLETVRLELNLPVKPMLAKPMKGVKAILDRFSSGDFTCEYKYDGERAQIHYQRRPDGPPDVRIFSRNSENHTTKYPDIIHSFREKAIVHESVQSFILDSEVVAYDREERAIKPFQVLQGRSRKDVLLDDVKVTVCVYAFDMIYLNGKPLLDDTFVARREKLRASFAETEGHFQYATAKDCTEAEDIEAFLGESIKANCEGLMVKTLVQNSQYTPSRRTFNWLKLKKDYIDGVGDSVDLVPIGAWYGKGKRTGVYSAYLLACYDPEGEVFQSICKVGTGFKDEDLTGLTTKLQEFAVTSPPSYYLYGSGSDGPEVWFSDACVWEVKAADLSISPKHKAAVGLVDPHKGIALRFPRFIRERDDKPPAEATSSAQIAELYRAQFAQDDDEAAPEAGDTGNGGGGVAAGAAGNPSKDDVEDEDNY